MRNPRAFGSAVEPAKWHSRRVPLGRSSARAASRRWQTPRASEVVYWIPQHRALVVGDVLLGAGAKPRATADVLRLCPERWLVVGTHDDLRTMQRPLLEPPVERILVSHGEPVLAGGRQALAAVLG